MKLPSKHTLNVIQLGTQKCRDVERVMIVTDRYGRAWFPLIVSSSNDLRSQQGGFTNLCRRRDESRYHNC